MPTSMILRFRDLAGPVGSTIARHKEIISASGGVWWAWWNKPDEKVPRVLFAEFKKAIAKDGYLEAYLADSGTNLLYRVRIGEIVEAATEQPIESPNRAETPEYYRETPYKAWFRLTCINDVAPDATVSELQKLSYDEIPDFTDDPFITAYQDKRIFSLQEVLNRRHRTIYFVQPYKAEHRTHLVETLPKILPQNFIKEPIFAPSSFILHLSDLHFGPEHEFAVGVSPPGSRTLERLILDDLTLIGPPAAIIVSGDLTWQARAGEFDQARDFLERLRNELKLEWYHFIIVPGNHDFGWVDDPAAKPLHPQPVQFPPEEAKREFRNFYIKLFGIPPNTHFTQGRRLILSNYASVDIIGLSSSELEQKFFAGYGYVSAEQLDVAIKEMGWHQINARTTYRFVTLHHHLIPVVPEEQIDTYNRNYSITLDAGYVIQECVAHGVQMVVHGHQHQPFTGGLSRIHRMGPASRVGSLIVNASGSAGVRKKHIPNSAPGNCYTIYELRQDGVTIRLRKLSGPRFEEAEEWRQELTLGGDKTLSLVAHTTAVAAASRTL